MVKHFIQERNHVTRMRVETRLYHQGRRLNVAFIFSGYAAVDIIKTSLQIFSRENIT